MPEESDQNTPANSPDMAESESVNHNDLPPQSDKDLLPVVGLGGSAGSISALQTFFENIQPDLGIAYIVVIHLSPDYDSALPQIIAARTSMQVMQVTKAVELQPNCVYVVPPMYHLALQDSKIYLSEPEQERGQRVAVDLLFRTLAATHRSRAVAVVLSGNDSDGAIGIKRIKEHGGVTIAQDPSEAEFNGMPRTAIETGMIDWILPAKEIASKLAEWIRNEEHLRLPTPEQAETVSAEEADVVALREILSFLQARTGHEFAHYKHATVLRRIGRRLQVNSFTTLRQYADYIRTHPGESGALLQDLLISVTNFFRDPEAFTALETQIPVLFDGKGIGEFVRVWIAGCATGEEAYSVAMLLLEYAGTLDNPPEIQVFATDLDESALQFAREGLYPQTIVADVSLERLRRFFVSDQGRYRVKKEVRELVLFAQHNLLQDAPFSRLDLITCRNLLIYFNREAQDRVLELFHFALRAGGLLFLGTSETAEGNALFTTADRKHSLYLRQGSVQGRFTAAPILLPRSVPVREIPRFRQGRMFPTSPVNEGARLPHTPAPSPSELHERLLIQVAPPSILVDSDYNMVHLANNAERYVRFAGGEISLNVLSAVPAPLRLPLRTALFGALQTGQETSVSPLPIELGGETCLLGVKVHPHPVTSAEQSQYALLTFEESAIEPEVPLPAALMPSEEMVHRLEDELQHMRDYLRVTIEEHEVAGEELKAYNEELQAMNEELRSAAEELETSREEIQAANEELTTVNTELKLKIEEVGRANSDLQNLMASTDIATVFLSRELYIKRYTPPAAELFNFIPTDTGRPLTDLKHDFSDEQFVADAERVLRTLVPTEREVRVHDGRTFLSRISPYRTIDDKIDGVVLTLVDISQSKRAEAAVRQSEEQFRAFVTASSDAIYQMSPDWKEMRFLLGRGFLPDSQEPSPTWLERYIPEEGRPQVWAAIEHAIATKSLFELEHQLLKVDGTPGWTFSRAAPLLDEHGQITAWFGTATDITQRKQAEAALRESEEKYRTLFESIDEGYLLCDVIFDENKQPIDIYYLEANPAAIRLAGRDFSGRRMRDIDPNYEEFWYELIGHVALTGEPVRAEHYAESHGRWFDFYAFKIGGPQSHRVASVFQDTTERKQQQEQQTFLLQLSEALRTLTSSNEILMTASRILGEYVGANRVGYAEPRGESETFEVARNYTNGVPGIEGLYRYSDYGGTLREDFFAGRTVVRGDIANDPLLSDEEKEAHRVLQLGATLNRPLLKGNQLLAILFVHFREAHEWTPREIALIDEVAELTWATVERARIEEALREREAELARVQRIGGVGGVDIDVAAGMTGVRSPEYRRLHGLPADKAYETHEEWLARVHPNDREQAEANLRNTLAGTGNRYEGEYRIIRPSDGQERWISARLTIERDASGAPTRLIGAHIDITERKRAEAALQLSEEKYRALFNSMDEAFAVVEVMADEEGHWNDFLFLDANPAFIEHTSMPYPVGKRATELLGTPNPRWAQVYGEVAESGKPMRIEDTEPTLGRTFDLNIFRLGGPGSRRVAVLFTNITARKEAEAERERLLRETELARADADLERRRLLAVLEQLPVGVHIAEAPISNTSADYSRDYAGYYPAGHARAGEPLASDEWPLSRALLTGESVADHLVEIRRTDGTRRLTSISAVAVRDADGRVEGAVATSVDLTEMKRAEEDLRESQERLQLALDAAQMGTFIWYPQEDRADPDEQMLDLLAIPRDGTLTLAQALATQIHPDDCARYAEAVARSVNPAGSGVLREDIRVVHPDGSLHWISVNAQVHFEEPAPRMIATAIDITDIKMAERALQESRARWQAITDLVPDLLWSNDPTGSADWYNQQWLDYTGQTLAEATGHGWLEAIHPDDREDARRNFQNAVESGELLRQEHRIHHAADGYRWFLVQAQPVRDEAGQIVRWFGAATDVHEQRIALEKIQQSEERFRALISKGSDMITVSDAEGRITYASDTTERVTGFTPAEFMASHPFETIFPDDRARCEAALRHLVATPGLTIHLEHRIKHKDGSWRWVEGTFSSLFHEPAIRGLVANVRDISERKQAEEAMAASATHLAAIFSQATVGLCEIALDGRYLHVNDAFCRIVGRSREELLQLTVSDVTYPDDIPASQATLRRAIETGQPQALDKRCLCPDGSFVWTSNNVSLLRDDDGDGQHLLAVSVDVTARRQAEEALQASEERLRIAIDAGELAAWDWNVTRDEIIWNEQHFLLFGMTPREGFLHESDFSSHIHPDDYNVVEARLGTAVEKAGSFEAEFRIIREDSGEVRWMHGYGRSIEEREGRATRMVGVMLDTTERRQVQEVLQRSHKELERRVEERTRALALTLERQRAAEAARTELMRRIVNTQEEERGRISRELHDNLGQHLTAVALGLQALENQIAAITGGQRAAEVPQLDKLRAQVDALMRAAHDQARSLRPAELDAMGLEAALGQYIRDWSQRTEVEVDFQTFGWEERPAPEIETTLYRVVQEALTNVARHAKATLVSVILERENNTASAIVEDNGRGFDPEGTTGRLGLVGMRERLALVGGTLEIESIPGDGTTVFARVSLAPTH